MPLLEFPALESPPAPLFQRGERTSARIGRPHSLEKRQHIFPPLKKGGKGGFAPLHRQKKGTKREQFAHWLDPSSSR